MLTSLKRIKSTSATEVIQGSKTILYSYSTPVAMKGIDGWYYRATEKYSVTTSRHINQWLRSNDAMDAEYVTQERLNELIQEV